MTFAVDCCRLFFFLFMLFFLFFLSFSFYWLILVFFFFGLTALSFRVKRISVLSCRFLSASGRQ